MSGDENGQQNGDEDARKLFIGGLPAQAGKEDVENYFQQFGEVQMCTIKTDVYTGRSRGFGFLIFKDVSSVKVVLEQSPGGHEICGKKVDPKLATPQSGESSQAKSTKVFVGGLDKSTTKEEITNAFSNRGKVIDVYLPIDKVSNEPKGFAFVNFDNSSLAETLCAEGKVVIDGKECDIKKANSKSDSRGGGRGGFRGGRGGFPGRGGRGGYGYEQSGYGGYDQGGYGGGFGGGYSGGYGHGGYTGGYEQYGGGYEQGGYGGGGNGGGGYPYDGYSGQDQYKMKRGGRGGGYTPY